MGAMSARPPDDPEGPWIALLCVGILLTALATTVCVGLVALYAAKIEDVEPVLALFAGGALLVLVAAAGLELQALRGAGTHRR